MASVFTSIFRLKLCAKSPRLLLEKLYVCTTMSLRRLCLPKLSGFSCSAGPLVGYMVSQPFRGPEAAQSKTDFFPFLGSPGSPGSRDPGGGRAWGSTWDPGCRDTGCTVVQLYWGGAWPIRDPGSPIPSWIPSPASPQGYRDTDCTLYRDTGYGIPGYNCTVLYPFRNVEMSQNLKIVRSIVACRH